jgi:hypothetical protein
MFRGSRFTATTFRMLSGLLIWAAHFGVIYGLTGLACARGFADVRWLGIDVVAWGIGIVTLAALGGALAMIYSAAEGAWRVTAPEGRETPHFIEWMTVASGAVAIVAIVWEALPVLLVPTCA